MGKELTRVDDDIGIEMLDMMPMFMMFMIPLVYIMMSTMATIVSPMAQQLQAQAYQGAIDSRDLYATPTVNSLNIVGDPPYIAWIAADFTNKGPGKAYIGINTPGPWIEMESGEGGSINMAGADKRIEVIFYKADPGETATIEAIGKY